MDHPGNCTILMQFSHEVDSRRRSYRANQCLRATRGPPGDFPHLPELRRREPCIARSCNDRGPRYEIRCSIMCRGSENKIGREVARYGPKTMPKPSYDRSRMWHRTKAPSRSQVASRLQEAITLGANNGDSRHCKRARYRKKRPSRNPTVTV